MSKVHRVRLSDGELAVIKEALRVYISQKFNDLTESEIENLHDVTVNRAVRLYDRFTCFRRGKPKQHKPKTDVERVFYQALYNVEKWVFNYDTASVLARLITYYQTEGKFKLGKTEFEIWKRNHVLDEHGRLVIEEEDSTEKPLFWIKLGLLWEHKRIIDLRESLTF